MTTKIYKTITLDIEDFEYLKQVSRLENRSISNLINNFVKDFKSNRCVYIYFNKIIYYFIRYKILTRI